MKPFATVLVLLLASAATAQEYHRAPPAIARILEAPPTPAVSLSPDKRTLAILGRENLPTIADLSRPVLRLAGYRIDPITNGQAEVRVQWLNALTLKDLATGRERVVVLPAGSKFTNASWSPDGTRLVMVMRESEGLALWSVGPDAVAKPLVRGVNAAFPGTPYSWLPDSNGLVVRLVDPARGPGPAADATPAGPVVQESLGRRAAARTYEDLLTDAGEERQFDHHFTGVLTRVGLDGTATAIGKPGLWRDFSVSPDGRYLLTERLKRPYSYLLPAGFFPTEIAAATLDGKTVRTIVDRPLADDLPVDYDAVVKGPRDVE